MFLECHFSKQPFEGEKLSNKLSFKLPFIFNNSSCKIDSSRYIPATQHFQYHFLSISLITLNFATRFDCMKNVKIQSFSGPYFTICGLNTEIYSASLHIQSEWDNTRTRKNFVFGNFSCSVYFAVTIKKFEFLT